MLGAAAVGGGGAGDMMARNGSALTGRKGIPGVPVQEEQSRSGDCNQGSAF